MSPKWSCALGLGRGLGVRDVETGSGANACNPQQLLENRD